MWLLASFKYLFVNFVMVDCNGCTVINGAYAEYGYCAYCNTAKNRKNGFALEVFFMLFFAAEAVSYAEAERKYSQLYYFCAEQRRCGVCIAEKEGVQSLK